MMHPRYLYSLTLSTALLFIATGLLAEGSFSEVMYHFFCFANVEIEVVSFAPLEGVVD